MASAIYVHNGDLRRSAREIIAKRSKHLLCINCNQVLDNSALMPTEGDIADMGNMQQAQANGQTSMAQMQQLMSLIEGGVTSSGLGGGGLPANFFSDPSNFAKLTAASDAYCASFVQNPADGSWNTVSFTVREVGPNGAITQQTESLVNKDGSVNMPLYNQLQQVFGSRNDDGSFTPGALSVLFADSPTAPPNDDMLLPPISELQNGTAPPMNDVQNVLLHSIQEKMDSATTPFSSDTCIMQAMGYSGPLSGFSSYLQTTLPNDSLMGGYLSIYSAFNSIWTAAGTKQSSVTNSTPVNGSDISAFGLDPTQNNGFSIGFLLKTMQSTNAAQASAATDLVKVALSDAGANYYHAQNATSGSSSGSDYGNMKSAKWVDETSTTLGQSQSFFQTQTQQNTSLMQQYTSQLTSYDQVGQSIVSDVYQASQSVIGNIRSS